MNQEEFKKSLPKSYCGLTLSRWIILITSSILTVYGSGALMAALITFFRGYPNAIIVTIVNRDLLTIILCTFGLCVFTGLIGILAVKRTDRHLLTCHTILSWPCLGLVAAIAYFAYSDIAWDLKTSLGMKWRYDFTPVEQNLIQENLHCCGFENSADHAMYMSNCSQESLLQGCSNKLQAFEAHFLITLYWMCFGMIPFHMIVIGINLVYSRPSRPWLGRYYGNTPALDQQEFIKHSHESCSKPIDHCIACENWTF